jgi:hypothetical protein
MPEWEKRRKLSREDRACCLREVTEGLLAVLPEASPGEMTSEDTDELRELVSELRAFLEVSKGLLTIA